MCVLNVQQVTQIPPSMTVQQVTIVQMVRVQTGNSALQVPTVTGRTWFVNKTAPHVQVVNSAEVQTWRNQQATVVLATTVCREQLPRTFTWRTWHSALLILNTSLLVIFVPVVTSVKLGAWCLKVITPWFTLLTDDSEMGNCKVYVTLLRTYWHFIM